MGVTTPVVLSPSALTTDAPAYAAAAAAAAAGGGACNCWYMSGSTTFPTMLVDHHRLSKEVTSVRTAAPSWFDDALGRAVVTKSYPSARANSSSWAASAGTVQAGRAEQCRAGRQAEESRVSKGCRMDEDGQK